MEEPEIVQNENEVIVCLTHARTWVAGGKTFTKVMLKEIAHYQGFDPAVGKAAGARVKVYLDHDGIGDKQRADPGNEAKDEHGLPRWFVLGALTNAIKDEEDESTSAA